uniref:COP9 signalosome subunit 3 n=1 Tax=Rhinolophus ferrumequinum TaxID=59479 RepID=A0A671EG07_RHIFE
MASALEQFVNSVRQLSAQGQMTQLCELINKSGELLAKNLSHLDTVLGALDVQEHSLGVLAVLFVKFSMPSVPDFETLFSQVQLFISTANGEHIRYATDTSWVHCIVMSPWFPLIWNGSLVFDFCYIDTNYNLGVSFLFEIELD